MNDREEALRALTDEEIENAFDNIVTGNSRQSDLKAFALFVRRLETRLTTSKEAPVVDASRLHEVLDTIIGRDGVELVALSDVRALLSSQPAPVMPVSDGGNWSIEPHGPKGQYALYEGRDSQHHGSRLCNLSGFDLNEEKTIQAILGRLPHSERTEQIDAAIRWVSK